MNILKNGTMILLLAVLTISCKNASDGAISGLEKTVKHKLPLLTEYNPVFLSKDCDKATSIKMYIPKPHPNIYGNVPYRKSGDSTHFVHVYMDAIKISEIPINDKFTVVRDSIEYFTGYKIIEFEMPQFSELGKKSGDLEVMLYSNNEQITSYKTNYQYLDDQEQIKVIRRIDVVEMRKAGPLDLVGYKNDYRIMEEGIYKDDIKYTHSIEKMEDHYISRYSAKGNKIRYRTNYKSEWKDVLDIPEFPILTSKIPLEFELEESVVKYQTVGETPLHSNSVGKRIVFDYYNKVIGSEMSIKYNNCKLDILEERDVYMPQHLRFNLQQ